ncbi:MULTISPECIES: YnfU family zinc-binding protein [Cedecea]|uniref:YnfU family zinc-binding protein n=1 Tax=Cedecea TaxID=158483 RepID=UPI000E207070|nr:MULTISPECIES: YnfU family zinc-binding protein [Cedecea]
MSYISFIKAFFSPSVSLACPWCGHRSRQSSAKVKKGRILVCTHCGTLFLPSECRQQDKR